jgi:para-nitrobenzyl esterase
MVMVGRIVEGVMLVCLVMMLAACSQTESDADVIAPPVVLLTPDDPVLVTGGEIQGVYSALNPSVMTFKGVPFAASPTDELRWRPPAPVEPWSGVRDTTTAGPICIQESRNDVAQSEDCLFLNIWAPDETPELRPVMVWIHGGGYTGGSGSTSLYDGTSFASRDVVLVTINYRLNVFGFLAHPALSAESEHEASGNYGLMDMVASLEWVRDNIASFGGDPDRVTVFGESAGGGAVMSLMLMPQADGLFHRAIAQSNYINGWDRQLRESVGDWTSAEAQGVQLAEAVGASGETALPVMRAATATAVKAAARTGSGDTFSRTGYVWAPNVDGWTIPADPLLMYETGQQHDVPLITGMNGNEGSLMALGERIVNVDAFESHVRSVYPDIAETVLDHYQNTTTESVRAAIDRLVHDMFFAGPVLTQARTHTKVTSPVWLYHFTRVPPTDLGATMGSHHAAELVYVFGTMTPKQTSPKEAPLGLTTEGDWTETDRQLSEAMMQYWVRFAATGNPNRGELPQWTEFNESTNYHLVLGDQVEESTELHDPEATIFTAYEKGWRSETRNRD